MSIEVDYNGFTFTFSDEVSDDEIYSFLEQNAESMASDYEEPAPKEAPLQRPFYEMAPGDNTKPSDAFTNPSLDLSGKTVETQEGVTLYTEGYTPEGKIDPRSPRWKGMSSNEIIEARNQDVRDGVIEGHIMRDGPAYDQNAQVADVSRDKDLKERQEELAEKHPEMSKDEIYDKASNDQLVDGVSTSAQAALMATPAGTGLKGMALWGAGTGAASEAIDVVAESAKGEKGLLDADNILDIAEGGALGGILGGTFGGLVKGAEKLLDFANSGKKVTNEVAELAAKYGIELTPGQKVDSKTIKMLEDYTAEGLGGKSILRTREDQVSKAKDIAEGNSKKAKVDFVEEVLKDNKETKILRDNVQKSTPGSEDFNQASRRMDELYDEASQLAREDAHILRAIPDALDKRKGILTKAYANAKVNEFQDPNTFKFAKKDLEELEDLSSSKLIKTLKNKEFGEDVWQTLKTGPSKSSKVEKFVKVIEDSGDAEKVKKALTVKFTEDAVSAGNRSGDFVVGDYVKFLKDNNSALKHFNKEAFNQNRGLIKLMEVIARGEKASAATASNPMMGLLSRFAPAALGAGVGGIHSGWEGAAAGLLGGAAGRHTLAKYLLPAISKSPEKFAKALETKAIKALLRKLAQATGDAAKAIEEKLIKALVIELDVEA